MNPNCGGGKTIKCLRCGSENKAGKKFCVPEERGCRGDNLQMIQQMETAGISVTRLDWRGGHGTDHHDRFIALADRVVKAMPKGVSVDLKGKLATSWSQIKSMK